LTMRLGLTKQVHFIGYVEDVECFFQKIDILVVPSLWAGYPYTVLEAIMHRVPMVLSDIPPHIEIMSSSPKRLFKSGFIPALHQVLEGSDVLLNTSDYNNLKNLNSMATQMKQMVEVYGN